MCFFWVGNPCHANRGFGEWSQTLFLPFLSLATGDFYFQGFDYQMISVSDSKHDCQILPKVDLPWRSSCHVFPLFFFMQSVTQHHLQSCFVRKTLSISRASSVAFYKCSTLKWKIFKSISSDCDHIVLNLEEAAAQECPKKNNWSNCCTRMSQEKQLKQ
jgi:hypothetical protein